MFLRSCLRLQVKDKAREVKKAMKQSSEMILKEELKGMKRVLRRLGMMNSDNVVSTQPVLITT